MGIRYTEDDIEVLTAQASIRKRPGMYLPVPVDSPVVLGVLVQEVLCWPLDEATRGWATEVTVTLHGDGSISVTDDGPGMPVDTVPNGTMSAVETIMTQLYACRSAKHREAIGKKYCHSGMVVTNSLSEWCTLETHRGGTRYYQRYERGTAVTPLVASASTPKHGTVITFRPDSTLIATREIDVVDLGNRLAVAASDVPETRMLLIDHRSEAATVLADHRVACPSSKLAE